MKINTQKKLLYVAIVVIPIIITAILFFNYQVNKEVAKNKAHAEWVASIHQRQWDSYINKVVSSLNILSLSIQTNIDTPEEMDNLLRKVFTNEHIYGGLFLLDNKGKTLAGVNDTYDSVDISEEDYILEVINSKDLVISNREEVLSNGQKVIGIAMPILSEHNRLDSIITAYLRVDYLINITKMLSSEENIAIMNGQKETILYINDGATLSTNVISMPIDRLPWTIIVELEKTNIWNVVKSNIWILLFFILIFHLIYLTLILYYQRKGREEETKQNEIQKLELVGNLAASSAHEIRNPLTGIKGLIQLLSEKHLDQQDQLYFSIIQKEIVRINEIVSQFLILGKPTAQKKHKMNLKSIIAELDPLIISEANLYNVNYIETIPEQDIFILGIADQMKQVLLNLTKNALEAMENGGQLELTVRTIHSNVFITIIDNGIGMSSQQLKKIFEPFNTSKESGTGLGLVVCKRIIESFDGEIQISSREKKGTRVNIILPLME
ncbi:ATP-binding protein [Niallia sp. FSL W8-0635]|uniref:ATP-binding protein n=1 Tax=Niallia sp. FSL W8-0635 TaxID=2975337 RepID=UPI0009CB2433|nr:sensor histidine kinase TcrY [Mycobacteroides abscessus subsp. abscessus]